MITVVGLSVGVLFLVYSLIKLPRLGFVAVVLCLLHTCWRSLLRLGLWSLPLVVFQYFIVADMTMRFPTLSNGKKEVVFG